MSKFEELLVNKGLYDSIDVSIEDLDELEKMLSPTVVIMTIILIVFALMQWKAYF